MVMLILKGTDYRIDFLALSVGQHSVQKCSEGMSEIMSQGMNGTVLGLT